jgi:hypothetical protein
MFPLTYARQDILPYSCVEAVVVTVTTLIRLSLIAENLEPIRPRLTSVTISPDIVQDAVNMIPAELFMGFL